MQSAFRLVQASPAARARGARPEPRARLAANGAAPIRIQWMARQFVSIEVEFHQVVRPVNEGIPASNAPRALRKLRESAPMIRLAAQPADPHVVRDEVRLKREHLVEVAASIRIHGEERPSMPLLLHTADGRKDVNNLQVQHPPQLPPMLKGLNEVISRVEEHHRRPRSEAMEEVEKDRACSLEGGRSEETSRGRPPGRNLGGDTLRFHIGIANHATEDTASPVGMTCYRRQPRVEYGQLSRSA